jgi:hypothetical protein
MMKHPELIESILIEQMGSGYVAYFGTSADILDDDCGYPVECVLFEKNGNEIEAAATKAEAVALLIKNTSVL